MKRLILLVVIPLATLSVAVIVYLSSGRYVETDNAYVKADKFPVSSEISGTIKEVLVNENQQVTAGQALFRLDAAPFELGKTKAEAELAQARTDLAALKASYQEKQAEVTHARTQYAFALKEQQRQADLLVRHFISTTLFEQAQETADLAKQQVSVQEEDLKRIAESLGGNPDTPIVQQ